VLQYEHKNLSPDPSTEEHRRNKILNTRPIFIRNLTKKERKRSNIIPKFSELIVLA